MSAREKRLLLLFGMAGFLVIHFLAFRWYQTRKQEAAVRLQDARQQMETARMVSASRDQVEGEMEWLAENEPEPAANQDVQTALEKLCDNEARSAGLQVKNKRPMPSDTTEGKHYHRAKFQFSVTGTEKSLYQWLDKVNVPADFRIATQIRLAPNKEDDTQIDCTAVVEQWFIPVPPSV